MSRYALIPIALLALLGATPAGASCMYPQPPSTVPDGATATHEDMLAAHRAVREFDDDIRTYTVCLELEAKTLLEDPRVDDAEKDRIRAELARRNNAAIDHVERVVTIFNEQLQKYRGRSQEN